MRRDSDLDADAAARLAKLDAEVHPEAVLDSMGESIAPEKPTHSPFVGFAAGLLSGWTKLIVGHPFDTIKTRLQCAPKGYYKGAADCFLQTVRREGPLALYKGASVPAVSWGITDSILMGSLHNYRACLKDWGVLTEWAPGPDGLMASGLGGEERRLSIPGHALAGLMAGWTNAAVAHPTETIKCKLQLQLVQPAHVPKQFKGPVDVVRQTVATQGITGMWRGLPASFMYRSCFAAMFGGFEAFNRLFASWRGTSWELSPGLANFLAGGLASNMYWFAALPMDNIKNRIMADSITKPKYPSVLGAYRTVWRETFDPSKSLGWNALARVKNFYKGFVPVVLRAFPTNAAALAVWEGTMRWATK